VDFEATLRRLALLITAAALFAPATAAAQLPDFVGGQKPLMSNNVEPLATLPVPHPIGARFRDGFMYVTTTEGLTVYDITNPELPVPVGALPLPHFENEDVDLGGDILLVSNDPSEGVGVLYIIDISNPRQPILKSYLQTGFISVEIPDFLEQPEQAPDGIGHTASCIQDCEFAYLAGTVGGIDIVDLRNPAVPKIVRRFKPAIVDEFVGTHDVQVDGDGLAWIVGGDGTAAYDVRDPVNPKMVMRTDENIVNSGQLGFPSPDPDLTFGIGGKGETPIDLIHHDSLRFHKKSTRGDFEPEAGKTYPAGGTGKVVGIVEEDYQRPTCEGAGSFQTWGITDKRTSTGARKLALLGLFQTELSSLVQARGWAPVTGLCSAHYFDERDRLVAGGYYEEGTRFLDVSDPTDIRQVGYWVPTKGETWSVLFAPTDPTGSIVYALDFARGIDVLRFDRSDQRTRTAPVRRTWLKAPAGASASRRRRAKSPGVGGGRTGESRRSQFGFVCRLAR
jgi:LVIVD repeat-containing protein